ncbi:hypothetical protein N7539_004347 [Penicillium diatomitis]|uniref:Pyroglutamyl peptidase type I n=1 Tax=Penicillium diatomitis TaxID=2819901 RepID=A0A9W9XEW4_9EURO|nr:uncharacterized protein N7539_004347 [Penicillium diatomitis]KAJ5489457.1 hypothetical protein N7539_004347 [Penicillium diatomitis]
MGDYGPAVPPTESSPAGQHSPSPSTSTDISVLITGFGPFKTNLVNASYLIASSLPPSLDFSSGKGDDGSTERRITLNVYHSPIRVAYATVREMVPRILEEYAATHDGQRPDLILHIGIASPRPYYSVESLAHRDDYVITDVDDQKGYEEGEKRWRELGLPPILAPGLATEEDIKGVRRSVSEESEQPFHRVVPYPPDDHFLHVWKSNAPRFLDLRISRDPGHYLCDFIFYTSLAAAKLQGADRNVLFLHVPGGAADHDIERGRNVALALIKTMVTCWIDDKRKDLA